MRLLALLTVCFLQILLSVRADGGKYSVIGPGTIHSGRKYNVAVGAHQLTEPLKVNVGIVGPKYNNIKTVELSKDGVENVEFDVPELPAGDYNLTAEGVSGIIFKNTTKLNLDNFRGYVKIQTDKGIYKPGETVQFRVLFLDENLRPTVPNEKVSIWLEDGKHNRVREIKNFEVVKGVYTGKFQLSEFPVLGFWRIIVTNADKYDQQVTFKVDKYTLPKYSVKVEATENVAVQDGDMQVVVRANYTYGKPVDAKVTLVLKMENYNYIEPNATQPPAIIKTADMVKGKAKFDLNVKEYEEYMTNKLSTYYLQVIATVEENFTGVKINGTSSTFLYPYRYFMHCVNYENCSTFYPDKDTKLIFKLTYVDNTPLKDTKSIVKLSFTEAVEKSYWTENKDKPEEENPINYNNTYSFESHLNDTSFANFMVVLPRLAEYNGYFHLYKMDLEYAGEKRNVFSIYQYREPKVLVPPPPTKNEPPKDYFKLQTNYDDKKYNFDINKLATVTVNSSEPLSYIVYNIIGRGNILHSERIELPDKPKEYNITFTTTFNMSPWSNIYVYYIDENGEFHHAETSIYTNVELQNKIEISAPEKVKPGEEVALQIKTPANSFVGFLAVDQSVKLLSYGNDISENDFHWRLSNYNTRTPWQGGYSYYPGQSSGVVTLTNGDYFYNKTAPSYYHTTFRSEVGGPMGVSYSAGSGSVNKKTVQDTISPMSPSAVESQGGSINPSSVNVRKDFSETWLFDNIENTETEQFTWSKKIPDTITKWVLTAFSINEEKGLGITKDATHITTFQPFFIAVRLPYSVKRGEVFNVPALVFNYLEKDLDVEITLDNTDNEFDFTEVSNEIINEEKRTKTIRVPGNSAVGVSFMIRPKIIGNIMLKFTAISPIAGDAVHKTLKVVPEGVTEYGNRAYLVNLKDTPEFKDTFKLSLPAEIVPDSQHVEFAVVGDLLGPMLNNLENLVRLPQGCGEQTMSKMVSNILVLRYLKKIGKLTPAQENKIVRGLEIGYQNMLNFQHNDGSFSSFGPSTIEGQQRNGSTWLTAYVVRSLHQAADLIKISDDILEKGYKYLASKQAENGTFLENGELFFNNQKRHMSLTASVLLAFSENPKIAAKYEQEIDKGFNYLLDNFDKTEDLRSKVLVVYTLVKAKHAQANEHTAKLKSLAQNKDDYTYWSDTKEGPTNWLWRWSVSNEVEVTAYMLLNLLQTETETVDSLLPILKWLVAQRNSYGGFYSTQDTIVGIQALIAFAEKFNYEPATADVSVTAKGAKEKQEELKINDENSLLMQTVELPPKTDTIDFKLNGKGTALVQISYQYNILEKDKKPSFTINTKINKDTPIFKLEMDVCVEYSGDDAASNMALMEISLPSGYIADKDAFERIRELKRVRQIETKNDDTIIVVYFESLHKSEPQCVPVEALRSFPVAMQKPASIVVYDYYDTSKKATDHYEVISKMCDICEDDEECIKACK